MIFHRYDEMVLAARHSGRPVPSRYGDTRELPGATFIFTPGLMVSRERINYAIGWQELLQLLAGDYSAIDIQRVAPRANLELFTLSMAYGPRVRDRIPPILDYLRRDPEGRQAVLFVGHPDDGPTERQPCTTSIHFLIRSGRLETYVSMRSWDLIKGLPYDVMMFGGLAMAVGWVLRKPATVVQVRATSAHVYDSDVHEIRDDERIFKLGESFDSITTWPQVQAWARACYQTLEPKQVPPYIEVRRKSR